jgi:hypothetical protein
MFSEHNDYDNPHDKLDQMPVYQKGQEIVDLVQDICALIDENNAILDSLKWQLLDDARILVVKIAGAEGGELYDIRMECATLIRKSAMNLYVSIHTLKMHGFEHTEYYLMVRKKIREFRALFVEWVAGFDNTHYIADRWGLFNPPGVAVPDEDEDENDDNLLNGNGFEFWDEDDDE